MTGEPQTPVCKDCYPTPEERATARVMRGAMVAGKMVRARPAPHPGPRCTTHWREKKKQVKADNHEKRVTSTYGLKKGEYAQLYVFQGGLCALCRRATGSSRKLSVDHDHASGAVRGLLCRPCNTLLGHARDKIAFFRRCILYLATTPYSQMKNGVPTYGEDPDDYLSAVPEGLHADEGREVPPPRPEG